MTDISGILRDKDDPSSLISQINVSEAPQLMREGVISGGMIPKVECCIEGNSPWRTTGCLSSTGAFRIPSWLKF